MPNHFIELINLLRTYNFKNIAIGEDSVLVEFLDCNDFKDFKFVRGKN